MSPKAKADGKLKVRQVKSKIGGTASQRETLRSLGLRRIGHEVVKDDKPEIRGMVDTVAHLVAVEAISSAEAANDTVEEVPADKPAKKARKATAEEAG